jgi:hypothetical protein
MALLLFSLRNVPDDEAEDIRDLLSENSISFYETHAGNWGISMPAIWLSDESQLKPAREVINSYQEERKQCLQKEYAKLKQSGQVDTFLKNVYYRPIPTLSIIAVIIGILYISIKLVFDFGF